MAMAALNIKLLRDLRRMWTQALSIAVITMIGTAAYIILVGSANSIQYTQTDYYEETHFANVFASAQYVPLHVADRLRKIDGVGVVTTGAAYTAVLQLEDMYETASCAVSQQPSEGGLNQLHIVTGRRILPGAKREAIVSEGFAKAHKLQPGDYFWATMRGHRYRLQVVGVALSPEYIFFGIPGAMIPDDRLFGIMWVDRKLLDEAFEIEGGFNKVSFSVVGDAYEPDVIDQIDGILAHYGGSGAYSRADHVSHATITSQIQNLRDTVKYAAPVFIGVVSFLLHMLMMRHIETEREQIGSFKAFGYSNSDIVWHYLKFVLCIVATGLIAGMLLGARMGEVATASYARRFHFPSMQYILDYGIFVQVVGIQLGAALVGCLHSLYSAAKLPPAVAMRPPPPPLYKRTLIERVLQHVITDTPSRMIVRHIVRWPMRSLTTILSISGAMAVLVAPMGSLNSQKHMVDVHFFQAERQDMTVAFGKTPSDASVREAQHYPGVQLVETFRNTAAKVEFRGKKRKVMILGRPPVNELSRPLDSEAQPIEMPQEGIIISVSMAEWLGARVGDHITLRFLEVRKPVADLPIVGLSENYMGMTFFQMYMDSRYLNKILRESPVVSGVHLQMDPLQKRPLYDILKKSPAVTGTITHSGSLAAMRRAQEQATKITYFNLMIAAFIIFGAVYNSARISLAERSRELAGMRLLGYTRWEVSYILLGELAILTLASLPIGSFMGYYLSYLLTEGASNFMYRVPLFFEWSSIGYAILSVLVMVAISGAFMSKRIFNLDLIATLKTKE